ncbi:Holliday junction branch migration protein RuvA [Pelagibius marinus]|uniref:Holliday junction branch migration protein RuvA n=1 Tax=Pelagibius marinus TaxID=2762760 RepID=UPI0018728C7C|nr:Holliday junction branch migration protein RuvA [Pelagibius marinus]
MIGKLTGIVDSTGDDWAILDVGGVGYLVFCSGRTLGLLPPPGGAATLWIETHVREDHIHLYGFAETAERDWFRLLHSVQGVGAKMALAVLSVLPPNELVRAIAAQDKASLSRASGVGPKLAGRIASELKDKAGGMALGPAEAVNGVGGAGGEVSEDAVSALVNLGYRRAEAFAAVAKASGELGAKASVESLIKAGLKELAS